jgi:hypothetical protein
VTTVHSSLTYTRASKPLSSNHSVHKLPTADVSFPLGSRTDSVPPLQQFSTDSLTNQAFTGRLTWVEIEVTLRLTVTVSMSWYRAQSGTCDQILLPVGTLLSEICVFFLWGALSERTDLQFAVQSLESPSCTGPVIILYCLIWDSPNLEGQVPVFISPTIRVAKLHPRALGSLYVVSYDSQGYGRGIVTSIYTGYNLSVRSSKLLYDWRSVSQSVSQYVLASSSLVGLATSYYFLSECCCLKVAILFLWGSTSDERTGL